MTRNEIRDIVRACLEPEIQKMKQSGWTRQDIADEPAMLEVLAEHMTKYILSLSPDSGERTGMWLWFCDEASPDDIRSMAATLRGLGRYEGAYDLECLADERERGTE